MDLLWVHNVFIGQLRQMINKLLLLFLLPGLALADTPPGTEQWLRQEAEAFVLARMEADPGARIQVSAGTIDSRLQLTPCEEHLTLSLPARMTLRRNTTVYLKCEQSPGWDLYLPVRISIQKPYLTVTEPLAKGTLLTQEKLTLAYQDEQMVRGDQLIDPVPLVGSRSKRDLRPGQPIRANQICVVCKDDQLTLVAQVSNLQIKSTVRALQDGSFGDMIRVINLQSGKTVRARVSGVGLAIVEMR